MLRSLGGIGRILAQTWPALLAWYLGGNVIRASVIAFAAPIGPENPVAALLLVPIVVLARLVSYIGMFFVLRRELPGYRAAASGEVSFHTFRDTVNEFVRVLLVSIGPFFTLYAVIGLLSEDLSAYARAAFRYSLGAPSNGVFVGASALSLTIVIVAFAGRMLLKILAPKLPNWVGVVEIYLEATWIFVALTAVSSLFGDVQQWINNRQIVVWFSSARDYLTGLWDPIRLAIDGLDWLTPVALQVILLPLAWLLIASIIYIRALANIAEDDVPVPRVLSERMQRMADRVPQIIRRNAHLVTGTWNDVGRPLVFSSRVILRAGLVNLAIFLTAYGLLYAGGQWLTRGAYTAVGAHTMAYWYIADPVLSVLLSAIIEPVRVVLLAVAFDYCLQRWTERRMPRHEVPDPARVTAART
jgi:hypothetical protein